MSELNRILDQVEKDKGIDKKILIEALELAMLTVAQKKLGTAREIEAQYNEEAGEIELFEFKTVVDTVENPQVEMTIKEAKEIDPDAQVNDSLGVKLDSAEFGRIAAQAAKQVIIQKVREAERDIVFNEYKDRKGEVVTGILRRVEHKDLIIDLGKTEAVLLEEEQVAKERYHTGDRIQAYISNVHKISRGPQIVLSRIHPGLLIKLFETEVPEIYEGVIKIKGAVREPGDRAKIAVYSEDSDVDPVGACVGLKGSRVQNVVQELRGEKIDIVEWDPDPAKFVCNAIAPAEVQKVIIDKEEKLMQIIVGDDQLSLAIGKRGQNVRLAAQLTGWKIDLHSESQVKKKTEETKKILLKLQDMDTAQADLLLKQGFSDVLDIQALSDNDLSDMLGISVDRAKNILENLKKVVEEEKNKVTKEQEEKVTEVKNETESKESHSEPTSVENNDTKE